MLVDTKSAAKILNMSSRTLERMRISGSGPVFCKLGKLVRYRVTDIDCWVEARRTSSTTMADRALGALRT